MFFRPGQYQSVKVLSLAGLGKQRPADVVHLGTSFKKYIGYPSTLPRTEPRGKRPLPFKAEAPNLKPRYSQPKANVLKEVRPYHNIGADSCGTVTHATSLTFICRRNSHHATEAWICLTRKAGLREPTLGTERAAVDPRRPPPVPPGWGTTEVNKLVRSALTWEYTILAASA